MLPFSPLPDEASDPIIQTFCWVAASVGESDASPTHDPKSSAACPFKETKVDDSCDQAYMRHLSQARGPRRVRTTDLVTGSDSCASLAIEIVFD